MVPPVHAGLSSAFPPVCVCVCVLGCIYMHSSLCVCFTAHAMRDGHHQGSATSERSRSVKDLKPCSPTEETDRLWCWCEQIKGSQNEWNEALSAVERPSHGTKPALLPIRSVRGIEEGRRKRRVCERTTHTKTGGEGVGGPGSYWFNSCAESKYCSVLYLIVRTTSHKGH